ncbi:MAG: CDP-alcohol phosphatidyltransferase family protein [Niabella sp.]
MLKQIPNLFTLLNLVFGCIAIIYIFKNDGFMFTNEPGAFSMGLIMAGVYIFLAAVVDFLDGFVARLFKATSEMGAQLDSLADAVTFGVAPGMIMYRLLQLSLPQSGFQGNAFFYLLPALLIPCCAVWRLAKFNLDKEQAYYFKGVPTPAAGLTIASLPFVINNNDGLAVQGLQNIYVLYGVILIISFLMISDIPFISLKFKNFSVKSNIGRFILLPIALGAIIFFKWLAVPVIFVAYVLVSLVFKPNKV